MKIISAFLALIACTFLYAQTSVELGDSNEFKQFISDQANISQKPLVFDKNNVPYFCYWKLNPVTGKEDIVVMKKSGNSWQTVGDLSSFNFPPIGSNTIVQAALEFDKNDTLHLVFSGNNSKLYVLKFSGSNWQVVGTPQTMLNVYVSPPQLKFDKNNTAYLSTSYELSSLGNIVVYRFNGTDWVNIHSIGHLRHINYPYGYFSLNIAPNDTSVYLSGTGLGLPGQGSASVIRYSPVLNKWDTVGKSPVYIEPDSNSGTTHSRILFDSKGALYLAAKNWDPIYKLYKYNGTTWNYLLSNIYNCEAPAFDKFDSIYAVAYINNGIDWYSGVYKHNGGKWDTLGNIPIVPKNSMGSGMLSFDKNNAPYVAYFPWSKKIQLLKFNGTSWIDAGGSVSGKVGLSEGPVDQTMIAVDKKNGTPYVIYRDASAGNKATVKKFNGTSNSWANVGSNGFSAGDINYTKLYVDTAGTPYAVYLDNGTGGKATMMKYDSDSGTWKNVGKAGFSIGASNYTTMAVDPNGTPFVAYSDAGISDKATVKKFNGSWVFVGNSGFSDGTASYTSMSMNKSGTAFISYVDASLGNKAIMKKFDGTNWATVGAGAFSPSNVAYTTMITDETKQVQYVLYTNTASGKFSVSQFDGNNWSNIGAPEFSDSIGGSGSIGLDRNGSIYIIFPHPAKENKASIMEWDGISWKYFGTPGFSAGAVTNPTLSFDKDNNVYVAYSSSQAFARKFINTSTGVYNAQLIKKDDNNVYPNPSNGELHLDINFSDIGKQYTIYDIQGKVKVEGRLQFEKNVIDAQNLNTGIYFLKISGDAKVYKLLINQ